MNLPRATMVLVHGAWHGAWCWTRVLPHLRDLGVTAHTLELPSVHDPDLATGVLTADATAVRAVIDSLPGGVVLCGHSYGGMVITHPLAGGHPRVRQLVYLCALMLDAGESPVTQNETDELLPVHVDASGMILPSMTGAAERFFGDCDADTQRWALAQLRPMRPPDELLPGAAWRSVSSSYIVCSHDRVIPVRVQRDLFAPRAGVRYEMQSSHSPFLSQPAALASLLAACMQREIPDA
jgi:pimeloyl-ACP methyl ester carboxylesterase